MAERCGSHQFAPGWLRETLDRARREVESWSPEKQEFARRATACLPAVDPCQTPRRCDEAQTCVGGCGLYNTTGASHG